MDINSFSINESPISVTLRNPVTGEDLLNDKGDLMQVMVVNSDSTKFRGIKSSMFAKNRKSKNVTFERAEAQSFEILALATTEFKGLQIGGDILKYSKDAAISLYKEYPWIKEQIDDAIVDRSVFLTNSGKD